MDAYTVVGSDGVAMKARPYQAQLEEIAIAKNTIIHLPTGSGKTFIAIRLIRKFRDALQKPWGHGGKRTFFLVNTVPLVTQQKKVIKRLCPVSGVGAYSGEDGVDYWDKSKWDEELTKNQVVVMTCQILSDMLTHTYIRIEDINLIIFDECHHAVDDHPMRLVMTHFEGCPVQKQPRVLGLTATLLNANVTIGQVEKTLRELETTFHATIATVNELGEVLCYSTNPHELVQYYRIPTPSAAARDVMGKLQELQQIIMSIKLPQVFRKHDLKLKPWQQDITTDPNKIIKAVKNMIVSMVTFTEELGAYGGSIAILSYIILLERLKRKSSTKEEELLYKIAITHSLEARMILLHSMTKETGYDKIIKHSSEKVIKLLDILKEYSPKAINSTGVLLKVNKSRKPLCAIIFTQQRFTAKILFNLLKDVKAANPAEFDFLKHDFIVGFNVDPFKNTREQHYLKKASQTALLKFSNGELNCLISTSVIEEGVDIPQCLLVLRYDVPLEYRSYIQSKGRARSSESSYVILVNAADTAKFTKNYATFQDTERHIHGILVGNTDDRNAPTMEDIQENLYEDDDIPPYVTPSGARLSAVGAISLLNRYCSNLPHDHFTVITPVWLQEKCVDNKNQTNRIVTVIMPIVSPVSETIKGMALPSLKHAKRSAALNACIRLHQEGELDSDTLLPLKYAAVDFDDNDVKSCFPNWPKDGRDEDKGKGLPKAGTKKRMRKHNIIFSSYLDAVPTTQAFCLHIIKMTTAFEKPKESRERALYDFLQKNEGYGFLTQKPLPQLCKFPAFTTVGEVTVSIEVNYAVIKLNDNLFELVKQFHYFVFDQILAVAKKFLVFEGLKNCMYMVPVKYDKGYDIDWSLMQQQNTVPPVAPASYEERRSLRVSRENYQYCVVTPWYRGTILPERYIVSDVLEYMTTRSRFESEAFGTYADYYTSKYNLEVFGSKDQPLLEVRNITTGMNCLLPRAATIKSFTDKQLKLVTASQGDDKPKKFNEVFIPEFCVKYDYPGVLWYKGTMLPSIVHRVHMLLVAHELLVEISKEIKYGQPHLTKGQQWQPIPLDRHVAIKSLLSQVEEPTPINSVDRINKPVDEDNRRRPKIASMKESLYQLQKKKINKEYPWDDKMEPIDIERNLSTVTVMDIECYDEFVSAPMATGTIAENVRSPPRAVPLSAAIKPPPLKYVDTIKILMAEPKGHGPELRDILAALTTINSHDAFNLERVETLGDSFLKFAASVYLYHKFPKLNEGQLTNVKGRLISNRNLYYAGEKFNLGGRMKVEQFAPRKDFLVPGFFAPSNVQRLIENKKIRPTFLIGMQFDQQEILSGQLSNESWEMVQQRYNDGSAETEPEGCAQNAMQCYVHSQAVSDKSVADCVEALIGTYLLSGGILGAVKLLEWMKIFPAEHNFAGLLHKPVPTAITEGRATEEEIDYLLNKCRTDIEKILNYKFKDPSYLLNAMTHSSYIRNRLTGSYERLEFLGDAILDFLITSHIFENCRELKPGDMTDLRSALVNNVTFAAYTVKLELHKYICSELNPMLENAIMKFVEHQEQHDHKIVVDVLYLIDEEECQVAEYVDVPKVLSDVFEALVGAIYLDCGGDLQTVWKVIYRVMCTEIDEFSACIPQQPVKVLYEMIHACPSFGTPIVVDPDLPKIIVPVTFTKNDRQHTVYGAGRNKSQAKRAAAKLALKVLMTL